jgi:uncharacterized protein YkwD
VPRRNFARLLMGSLLASVFGVVPASSQAATTGDAIAAQINKIRAGKGLKRLRVMPRLSAAARNHSTNLARSGKLHHNGFSQRISAARIPGLRTAGENVGYITGCSPSSTNVIVKMWMASAPHRRNILSPSFRMIGAGTALRGLCGATFATAEFAG